MTRPPLHHYSNSPSPAIDGAFDIVPGGTGHIARRRRILPRRAAVIVSIRRVGGVGSRGNDRDVRECDVGEVRG